MFSSKSSYHTTMNDHEAKMMKLDESNFFNCKFFEYLKYLEVFSVLVLSVFLKTAKATDRLKCEVFVRISFSSISACLT